MMYVFIYQSRYCPIHDRETNISKKLNIAKQCNVYYMVGFLCATMLKGISKKHQHCDDYDEHDDGDGGDDVDGDDE